MKKHPTLVCSLVLLALFLSACGGAVAEAQPDLEEPQSTVIEPAQPAPTPTPIAAVKEPSSSNVNIEQWELAQKAVADLSERLDIDPDQIAVIEAQAVDWPDSSLGCPQEGMMYAQVETAGFIVSLETNDNLYVYHTDTKENVVLCEMPQLPVFPIKPGEIKDGEPWMPN